jgi:aminoglycoside phosphotransferase (APT) family kinase protein
MLRSTQPNDSPELLACPVCLGPLTERKGRTGCRTCALVFAQQEGVYLLGPSFATNGNTLGFGAKRLRRLLAEARTHGWEEARRRFTSEVLSGVLRAPAGSRFARLRSRLTGSTWEDTLQDMVDPTRTGWRFLLDLHPGAQVLVLGPSWGAAPLALAQSCGRVVLLDGSPDRLRLVGEQARGLGIENLTLASIVDPLRLPLADASIEIVVVPAIEEWFSAVAPDRGVPPTCGMDLLHEIRRVLVRDGQVWLGTHNRSGIGRVLGACRPKGASFSAATLPPAAAAAGFTQVELFSPVPFRHKFHQLVDVGSTERMNFCADPYRTRSMLVRPLLKAYDALNTGGWIERRFYRFLPGVAAILSGDPPRSAVAERLVDTLVDNGALDAGARRLMSYFVRPKGCAVVVLGMPGEGAVLRLPLDERAAATCDRHHRALEAFASDERLPANVRRLFPAPLANGLFEGQPYFLESALPGEAGRRYYARSTRRYDAAITSAAEVLRVLRRATEVPTLIDEAEFARLCGDWLVELRGIVNERLRAPLAALEQELRQVLVGATLPLGWHHGDYDFANLLYGETDEVTAILDFEVFESRGLPLIDLLVLLARRALRHRGGFAFGTLFVRSILERRMPPLEAKLLAREVETLGIDERLYRALALCCWLDHLRLRRDSWLVRSPSWLEENLHDVIDAVGRML